jgi:hypothetical protein
MNNQTRAQGHLLVNLVGTVVPESGGNEERTGNGCAQKVTECRGVRGNRERPGQKQIRHFVKAKGKERALRSFPTPPF